MKKIPVEAPERPILLGKMALIPSTHELVYSGKKLRLRPKEYELLEFLAQNRNRVVNRLTILEYVWNYQSQAETNTLEVHMMALRRKIEPFCRNRIIQTVYGLGYRLSITE